MFLFFLFFVEALATSPLVPPIVMAHRGACGYLPEHTLPGYKLAIEMKADFIEFDVVSTSDHQLMIHHDIRLNDTTDIRFLPQFANRTREICWGDGYCLTDWFVNDFTLAEMKELRVVQRLPFRNHSFDDLYTIPSLLEGLDFLLQQQATAIYSFGVYIETKAPQYFDDAGLPLESLLIANLASRSIREKMPLFFQSFELESLKKLRSYSLNLIYLMNNGTDPSTEKSYWEMFADRNLKELSKTVNGLGPAKELIFTWDNHTISVNRLVERAHFHGLWIHPYTFRSDPYFLDPHYHDDPALEYALFFSLGIDGLFSDFADTAVASRNVFLLDHIADISQYQARASDCQHKREVPIFFVFIFAFVVGIMAVALTYVIYTKYRTEQHDGVNERTKLIR